MKHSEERILNAFLDEMLNDSRPGRSAEEILRNIKSQLAEADSSASSVQPSDAQRIVADQSPAVPSNPITPATHPNVPAKGPALPTSRPPTQPRSKSTVAAKKQIEPTASRFDAGRLILIAALVTLAAFISYRLIDKMTGNGAVVENDNNATETDSGKGNGSNERNVVPPRPTEPKRDNRLAENDREKNEQNAKAGDGVPNENPTSENPDAGQTRMAIRDDVPDDQNRLILPPEFRRTRNVSADAIAANEMSSRINVALNKTWTRSGVQPAKALELRNWANRLSNRVLGRTLTADEMASVNSMVTQAKPASEVRNDLVDLMLQNAEFRAEFDRYWGRTLAWEFLGISQTMEADDSDMVQTRNFLADKIARNQPMDQVAYQLLSAVGSTDKASEKHNPASSYLVALTKRFGSRQPAIGHVAQSFMGSSVQCAQCHNGYSGSDQVASATPTQKQFHELNSFFAQLMFEPEQNEESFYLVNRNFLPFGREGKTEAPLKYQDTQGNQHEALPKLGSFVLGSNGFVEKVDRRSELASYIANSDEFAQTLVDHVWVNLLNIPIGGIDGNAEPELAQLRTDLAKQFASNNYQLEWLVKAIAQSDAFAVGVGTDQQLATSNPFLGAAPRFDQFYYRIENRRSAIQSLTIVASAYRSGDAKPALSAGLMARIDAGQSESKPNTILPFIPSKESEWATSKSVSTQLELIAASSMSDEEKVKHIVLAAVGRTPYPDELKQAMDIYNVAKDKKLALQDVWWSLVNSVDFRLPRSNSGGLR